MGKKWIKYIVVIIVLMLASGTAFIIKTKIFSGTTIDLNKYLVVGFDGYNGLAKVNCSLDYEQMAVDYQSEFRKAYELADDIELSSKRLKKDFEKYIEIHVSKTENVANGERLDIVWNVDKKSFEKYFGMKVKYVNTHSLVEGIETAILFDPFDYCKISIEGTDGSGNCKIYELDDEMKKAGIPWFRCQADFVGGLKNGDQINISIVDQDEFVERCKEYGFVPIKLNKTVAISGLSEFTEFDPFEYLEVSYDNVNPGDLPAFKLKEGAPFEYVFYTFADKLIGKVHKGDRIIIYAGIAGLDRYDQFESMFEADCMNKLYHPTRTMMGYTIEGN